MAAAEGGATECAPFNVTVLGPSQSGKTSIVNSFVNSFVPSIYSQTDDPVLYYKTLYLVVGSKPPNERERAVHKNKEDTPDDKEPFPVLVEIADTYASDRTDGSDCYGLRRDSDFFFGFFPTKRERRRWGAKGAPPELLGGYRAPTPHSFAPISLVRMAFLLVFDVGDEESFRGAVAAHEKLEQRLAREMKELNQEVSPVLVLVANKADMQTTAAEYILDNAREYALQKSLDLVVLSSHETKKVKEMFRRVLKQVYWRRQLWDQGGNYKPAGSLRKQAQAMHSKVLSSGRSAVQSGRSAMRAGQEQCGVPDKCGVQ